MFRSKWGTYIRCSCRFMVHSVICCKPPTVIPLLLVSAKIQLISCILVFSSQFRIVHLALQWLVCNARKCVLFALHCMDCIKTHFWVKSRLKAVLLWNPNGWFGSINPVVPFWNLCKCAPLVFGVGESGYTPRVPILHLQVCRVQCAIY